ncbi:polysaccharide biosynthesis/export family protein [Silvibacterium dinghuense]|uniref:polysaccharide biosynthesis/export family protein n=1 Tax=Silvibacterium dinghuense TaxID=1560006 RepID=UPI0013E95519|nr:polysaccharide biosynthesis/export family protein [Silvibacterium dinghuense]
MTYRSLAISSLLFALPVTFSCAAWAQQTAAPVQQAAVSAPAPAAADQPADPQLKLSPTKALEQFEPAADAEYQLGPGDEISIEVPGHADLSGKYIVGPDGRITLPVAGTVEVNDKTRQGASAAIRDALTPYYTDVTVTTSIDKYGSNHVTVLGNVKNPGMISFDDTPTLMGAISKAGLSANPTSKDGIPDTCVIYRGNNTRMDVDLRQLIESGSTLANMRLRRNDIVFVPAQKQEVISVMGEVNHPGPVTITPDLTLHLALAEAGGLTHDAGKNIYVVQASTGKTVMISYKDMMAPNGDKEIALHAGDSIYVKPSGLSKMGTVVQKLGPAATLIELGAIL